jgi:riboflavin kinase/FMN adenylyltransferase
VELGYPTANLKVRARPCPLQGVFAVFARCAGGRWLPAVSNLGYRPVVGGREPLLEVHFFDFDKDLYGQRLEVQFVAKLRDELNFESMDELVDQMKRDESLARTCLAQATMPQ